MRATARLLPTLALVLAGCSPLGGSGDALGYDKPSDAGQPEYTYPGCANEDGLTCPRSATALCAVELAAQGRGFCLEDYDCELVWLTPRCLEVCEPLAVGFDELLEARASMQREIDRYCSAGPCAEAPCTDAGGAWVATCSMGFCAAVWPDDAGPPPADAGSVDDEDGGADLDAGSDLDAETPDA